MSIAKSVLGLAVAAGAVAAFAGGAISLGVDGEIVATVFNREYTAGIRPGCLFELDGKKEIFLSLPVHYAYYTVGTSASYMQRTSYFTLGCAIGLFWRIYANRHVTVSWGPELFGDYGLPPMTRTTMNGMTTVQKNTDCMIASGGCSAPINVDLFFGDRWGIRLSERFLRLAGEGRYNGTITNDNRVTLNIGIEKMLAPSLSILRRF